MRRIRPETTRRIAFALVLATAAGLLAATWDGLDPLLRGVSVASLVLLAALGSSRGRSPAATPPDPRVEVLDRVVADETRRPWNATTLPWQGGITAPSILLVPAADYHLAEVVPLAAELDRRGMPSRIAIGSSPWSRTWPSLSAYPGLEVFELPDALSLAGEVSAIMVMKDTGSIAPLVEQARQAGIPVFGKVEGAQDFWDADTPEKRRPYRNLDLVLCQGRFDAEALADRPTSIVGSSRLERLWWAPPVNPGNPLAVINLNFVYGVGTKDRTRWLDTAIEGCSRAGIPYLISIHPAERARPASDRVTSISASRLLPHATVLISRFSTMPFEAMARGVPFIYHNPHGEAVRTFADPLGAFEVTTSAEGLAEALGGLGPDPAAHRARVEPFFGRHVDIDRNTTSERRGAEAIAVALGG
jgi:hypothetical protein